jgi:hypothetical protein
VVTSKPEAAVFAELKGLRRELGDKLDRVRDELIAAGSDPKRLTAHKRRVFVDCGLALRLLEDIEAQLFAGASDDVPGTISHLIALLKQLQTAALPGNATPLHGTPVTSPPPSRLGPPPRNGTGKGQR